MSRASDAHARFKINKSRNRGESIEVKLNKGSNKRHIYIALKTNESMKRVFSKYFSRSHEGKIMISIVETS